MSAQAQSQPGSSLSTPRIVVSPWIVLLVLAMGFFMILLDTTIVNVAIPSIIDGLHASLDQILWVLNAYILVYAVLLITSGRLGDMVGPKRMTLIGLVLFTLASAACGLAQSPNQLIAFRVLQGVGGAIVMPQSLSIITSIFPPEKRGAAFGLWSGLAGLAAASGPTLGGVLTTSLSWRAIFYVNVPLGIAAFAAAYLLMPELTIHRRHRLDVPGVALATVGLFALVSGLIEGQRYSWGRIWDFASFSVGPVRASLFSIPTILAGGIILLVAFVLWEIRPEEPLLPLSLFRDLNFSMANSISGIFAFGMLGLFLPVTIFLQSVLGLKAVEAGVVFLPLSLTSMVVAPLAGRLSDRINAKWILAVGLALYAIGMGLVIFTASLQATGGTFTLPLIVAGFGMGCSFAPIVTLAMRDISPTQAGAASGFLNTTRQVGGAMGSAIVGAVLQNQLSAQLHEQATRYASRIPPAFRGRFIDGFSHAAKGGFQVGRGEVGGGFVIPRSVPPAVVHQLQTLGRLVFRHAYLNAMKPSLAITIVALLIGATSALFMRGGKPSAAEERKIEGVAREELAVAGG